MGTGFLAASSQVTQKVRWTGQVPVFQIKKK
jgi:hypothetical protein